MSDGSYRDTVIFSIIESEWKACKHSLNYKIEQNHKKPTANTGFASGGLKCKILAMSF